MKLIFILIFIFNNKLLKVIIYYRHGIRNQNNQLLNPLNVKKFGNLTEVGMRQHYILGQLINKMYNDFLKQKPFFECFTSKTKRTHLSALANNFGIFNNYIGYKIEDSYFHFDKINNFLKKYNKIQNNYNYLKKIDYLFIGLYNKIENSINFKNIFKNNLIVNLNNVKPIIDILLTSSYSKLKLNYNHDLIDHMLFFLNIYWSSYQKYNTNNYSLREISKKIIKTLESNKNEFIVFSGHDTGIIDLSYHIFPNNYTCIIKYYKKIYIENNKNERKNYLKNCINFPFYSSNIIIELHMINNKKYIKLLYDGKEKKIFKNKIKIEWFINKMKSFIPTKNYYYYYILYIIIFIIGLINGYKIKNKLKI